MEPVAFDIQVPLMAYVIELTDDQWKLVADLFDPPSRRGAAAQIPQRKMVNAMLFLPRTGCQWRYLPQRYGEWGTVWQQWRRWRVGVSERAMALPAREVRQQHAREASPSMIMIDAQTVRGGRAGPTFHNAGGREGPRPTRTVCGLAPSTRAPIGSPRILTRSVWSTLSESGDQAVWPHQRLEGRSLVREMNGLSVCGQGVSQ